MFEDVLVVAFVFWVVGIPDGFGIELCEPADLIAFTISFVGSGAFFEKPNPVLIPSDINVCISCAKRMCILKFVKYI